MNNQQEGAGGPGGTNAATDATGEGVEAAMAQLKKVFGEIAKDNAELTAQKAQDQMRIDVLKTKPQ